MAERVREAVTPIVHIHTIDKWYGQYHALRAVDLTVSPGECVVLWGPSGSGKTTLLRCIAGLEPAQRGAIEVAGSRHDVGPLVRPSPSRGVGMVFQRSALFRNLRVIDNLTIGLRHVLRIERRKAETIATRYLAQVRMAEYAMRYPAQLSGGQQQRVEIARALCMEPQLLLFDEPTASLDPELKREVGETIAALAREGRTVVVATHEPILVHALPARVVLMREGAVVGESTSEGLFASR
jgi:ABC-type polar amino acid transport system ATPase subunit